MLVASAPHRMSWEIRQQQRGNLGLGRPGREDECECGGPQMLM